MLNNEKKVQECDATMIHSSNAAGDPKIIAHSYTATSIDKFVILKDRTVMPKLMVIVFFYFTSLIAKSQNIVVEGTAPNLYITHIVAPKENFYSVSRLYNQSPKLIASYNKITMEKGLSIGERIKIPLNRQNLDNTGNADGALIPLTHIVAKSETLFRIGSNVNTTAESIRKWNKLSSDKIAAGTALVVGYLKTTSALKNSTASAAGNNKPVVESDVKTKPKPATTAAKKETSSLPDNTLANKEENTAEIKKPDESTEAANASKKNTAEPAEKDTALAVAAENAVAAKEEPARQQETPVAKNQTSEIVGAAAGTFAETYTKQASQKSENTKSGEAATFKSTSGWQDKKYYVLINDIPSGTIIKISSGSKAVYAKVLGSMPEMKENTGLLLRVSNAAASDLGIIDPKFPVQVSYYQ